MKFVVGPQGVRYIGEPIFRLIKDGWNDWFKWYTLYAVHAILGDSQVVELGHVKIGRRGMTEDNGSTTLPQVFEALDESYFSLGC